MNLQRVTDVQRLGAISEEYNVEPEELMSMLLLELVAAQATDPQWEQAIRQTEIFLRAGQPDRRPNNVHRMPGTAVDEPDDDGESAGG
jgi:hypothetical protein